jgi:hypothetical protein
MRLGLSCLGPAACALCFAGVTGAAGTTSFADPAGDSDVAPDVTSVVVSNDDQGLITFRVTVVNRSALGPDDVVAIPFATNAPGKAGVREDGANFVLGIEGTNVFLEKWNGSSMVDLRPVPSSLRGSLVGSEVTLTVRQDDLVPGFPSLAVPTVLGFYVLGLAFDGNAVVAEDDAPDASDQFWTYHLLQPPRIVVAYLRAPMTVRAGSRVVARIGAAWSDTGRVVKPTKLSCRAKVGSRALRGTAAGPATCSWSLRKGDRGKTLRGSVTLTSGAVSVTRSFTTRVR